MTPKKKLFTPEQAVHLKKAYHNKPEEIIHDFCHLFTVRECRGKLWKMLCAFLGSEHSDCLNKHERSDYLFLYEMLLALIEASYLIDAEKTIVSKRK